MSRTQFVVSWIYDEFHVCRISRGKIAQTWISQEPVGDLAAFHEALIKASTSIGMNSGGDVAIAFESDDHAHVFLELPPMNRRDMEKYLARRVEQEKEFDEPAVWSYRSIEHEDHSEGVLLHVMPKRILDAMIRICQENHVTPMRLLPLTDVMAQHIPAIREPQDELILVVALFDERVEIVVTTDRGEILFVRELKYHWREDQLERLRVDIERTVLYIKQRQKTINRVSIMGTESEHAAEAMAAHVPFPVEADPDSLDPYFWAREVGKLGNEATSNFIPKTVQRSVMRKRAVRTASWLAVAAVLSAISVTGWVEYLIYRQNQHDPELIARIERLIERRDVLQLRATDAQAVSRRLVELSPQHPPIPAWFLSRLGELLPDDAVLSKAELAWSNGAWVFTLEGATTPTLAESATTLATFEQRLSSHPWNATVSSDWRIEWLDKLRLGKAAETGLVGFRFSGDVF